MNEAPEVDPDTLASAREDYSFVRVLPDGSIAGIDRLLFTTGLFLGITRTGYERRFCFADHERALIELFKLQSEDDEPTGWVARRPETAEDIAAKMRPGYTGGPPRENP